MGDDYARGYRQAIEDAAKVCDEDVRASEETLSSHRREHNTTAAIYEEGRIRGSRKNAERIRALVDGEGGQ